jgi:hypothetical protein
MSAMSRDVPVKRATAAADLTARLAALPEMAVVDLRTEWRRLYRADPPKGISRQLLELAVAWKLQERVHGGLSTAVKRRLGELAKSMDENGDLAKARAIRLKPGVRLIREWQGQTHDVLVLEDGFQWRGKRWRSLSAIAREISGAHWSGPRFFGLQGRAGAAGNSETVVEEAPDA